MVNYFRDKKLAFLFILPQLLIILLFFIFPAIHALGQAFLFSDAFGLQVKFAGLSNFHDLLNDPDFIKAVGVTLILAFFISLVSLSIGLFLAVLVKKRKRSQQVYKTLFLWPYAVAPAVSAMLWRFLCQPTFGWFSYVLNKLGITFNYLIYPKQALLVIIMAASWQQLSYNFLFFFAALKAIPPSLIEAAIIDGASSRRIFWQIMFPLLSPTTFFLLIVNLTYAFFDTFGIIDVLTSGGPYHATTTLIYKIYKDGFVGMDLGSSSAQSVILMIVVSLLIMVQFRYLEKKVYYE